jgi:pimeloyl-ACP methyl ester carboxylesterase
MVKEFLSIAERMNARVVGSGTEAMVLSHGYGGDQSVWDKLLPHLAQRYTILVFDWNFKDTNHFEEVKYSSYQGFAQDLIDLVEETGLTKYKSIVFVGHSMSCMIGCIASIQNPLLFNHLILISGSPRYLNSEEYQGGFDKPGIDQIFSSIESDFHSWATIFSSLVVDPKDPNSVNNFKNSLQRMDPNIALCVAKTVFLSDERDILDKVVLPCTLIHTSNDITVPKSVIDYMKKNIKGKTTVEIVDAQGHFPHLTAPDHLLQVLDRTLGSN